MTNSTNASLQWEVAGGKKITTRKVNTELNGAKLTNGKQAVNGKQDFISKIPKLATSPPLKTESSMYDLIRESDDDSDYEARKKQEQKAAKKPTGSAPVSPKQKQHQPQEQPLNLLKTSIISSQKKSPKPAASPRRIESELETALSQLSFENVQNEYIKLEKLFPDNQALIVYNLATFVNQTLNHIPDIEPTHGNEPYLTKLDKKVEKFFNNLINRLKKADSDSVFDQCFGLIFADNPRVFSHHGIILFVQLLLRQNPNLLVNSFTKCIDLINSSRHRHQRVLIALRSLSQIGYSSLSDGIRIWFDVMLPLISTKGLTNYIATYLSALFEYHKSSIAKQTNIQSLIDCDQYLDFYDMVNDKSFVLSKDAQTKFKSSFQQIRNIFFQNLSDSEYFEPILSNLVNESTPKQSELLEILSHIVMANRDALTKWRKIYYKTLLQSTIFLEHLAKTQSLKSLKEMRETLKYFEYHTDVQLAQTVPTNNVNKDVGKHHYYKKSQKSSSSLIESERLRAFNKLVKVSLRV